jgi:predicted GIY-YIG superfamily endonuclease
MHGIMATYYAYIMVDPSGALHIGARGDLARRVSQQKLGVANAMGSDVDWLPYSKEFGNIQDAIRRVEEIEGWQRGKAEGLVGARNPSGRELSKGWKQG